MEKWVKKICNFCRKSLTLYLFVSENPEMGNFKEIFCCLRWQGSFFDYPMPVLSKVLYIQQCYIVLNYDLLQWILCIWCPLFIFNIQVLKLGIRHIRVTHSIVTYHRWFRSINKNTFKRVVFWTCTDSFDLLFFHEGLIVTKFRKK